ncbi:amp dependent CoA ligase [Gloeopeniophorella convolvens]|nr:amp dependent CoA ligase [Gloeopeniophorella convolvens]
MPYSKSMHPPTPAGPSVNYYEFLLGRPALQSWPDYTLFIDAMTGKRRRFRETVARIEECATALTASKEEGGLGIEPGNRDVIGILSENSTEYVVLALALLKISVPVAFIPAHSPAEETTSFLKRANIATLFISPKRYARSLDAVRASGVPEDQLFILQGHVQGKTSLVDLINHVKLSGLPRVPTQPLRSDTLACIMFSSARTGSPKAVMISHRNLYRTAMQVEIMNQASRIERAMRPLATPEKIPISLAAVPFCNAVAANAFVLRLFVTPTTLIILPRWNVDVVAKMLLQHTITQIAIVPSMKYQLLNHPELSKVDWENLGYVSTGDDQLRHSRRGGFEGGIDDVPILTEGYGLPESTLAAISQTFPDTSKDRRRGMANKLLADMKERVVREDSGDANLGEIAELLLRGQNAAVGYRNDKESNKEASKAGDKFVVDEQGRFFYVDEMKQDTVNAYGAHAFPSEIEKVIREHPEVRDCAVAGVRGVRQSDGIVPRAWVVLSDSAKAKGIECVLEAIQEYARHRLHAKQWPHGGFEIIDEIPRLPNGRTLRRQLQHAHENRERGRVREQAKL